MNEVVTFLQPKRCNPVTDGKSPDERGYDKNSPASVMLAEPVLNPNHISTGESWRKQFQPDTNHLSGMCVCLQ